MDGIAQVVSAFGPVYGLIALFLILLIVAVLSINPLLMIVEKANKGIKNTERRAPTENSNVDNVTEGKVITINTSILIYLFEIHTKYKDDSLALKHQITGMQLDYAENILDQIINNLVKLYRNLQEEKISEIRLAKAAFDENADNDLISDKDKIKLQKNFIYLDEPELLSKEYLLYKESLRSAFKIDLMKAYRQSFRLNGFYKMNDEQLKQFVLKKVEVFSIIVTKYLSIYFPIFDNMLIKISDERAMEKIVNKELFFEKTLDIFQKARSLWNDEYLIKEAQIKLEFEKSINTLLIKDLF